MGEVTVEFGWACNAKTNLPQKFAKSSNRPNQIEVRIYGPVSFGVSTLLALLVITSWMSYY